MNEAFISTPAAEKFLQIGESFEDKVSYKFVK